MAQAKAKVRVVTWVEKVQSGGEGLIVVKLALGPKRLNLIMSEQTAQDLGRSINSRIAAMRRLQLEANGK